MMTGNDAVTQTLHDLDDEDAAVWTAEEILLYIKDGYDKFCRETKCLFDMHVIPNVPPIGNWGSDLERYLAQQTPGMGLTDNRLNFTGEDERNALIGGLLGPSMEGPTPGMGPGDADYYDHFGITFQVHTGRLPDWLAEVIRVTWDEYELTAEGSATMRQKDSQYEIGASSDGGDPRYFTLDKDGLLTLRIVPPAGGDADYPTVENGPWGTITGTLPAPDLVTGTWGILREREGHFPAGGPHGTVSQRHPAAKNIVVEIARLGRSLDSHPFEIPDAHVKFIVFWAMHRALKREGPGQDLRLAEHFADRYSMGVSRMMDMVKKAIKEKVLQMGSQGGNDDPFGMGDPQLPYPYGPATGRRF